MIKILLLNKLPLSQFGASRIMENVPKEHLEKESKLNIPERPIVRNNTIFENENKEGTNNSSDSSLESSLKSKPISKIIEEDKEPALSNHSGENENLYTPENINGLFDFEKRSSEAKPVKPTIKFGLPLPDRVNNYQHEENEIKNIFSSFNSDAKKMNESESYRELFSTPKSKN